MGMSVGVSPKTYEEIRKVANLVGLPMQTVTDMLIQHAMKQARVVPVTTTVIKFNGPNMNTAQMQKKHNEHKTVVAKPPATVAPAIEKSMAYRIMELLKQNQKQALTVTEITKRVAPSKPHQVSARISELYAKGRIRKFGGAYIVA